MHRLFILPEHFDGDTVRITGMEHNHLARVLRARVGQPIVILDGQGSAYHACVSLVGPRESVARITGPATSPPEPAIFITVGQALGKGDKFEQVVQHGTEAGASAFVPVRGERCVAELPAARAAERIARWQAIAKGAAEQSFRARIPEVAPPATLGSIVAQAEQSGALYLFLHPDPAAISLRATLEGCAAPPERVVLLIGPEGGWSENERRLAAANGCLLISLGPYILRTETAALVAISQLAYHFSGEREITLCES